MNRKIGKKEKKRTNEKSKGVSVKERNVYLHKSRLFEVE